MKKTLLTFITLLTAACMHAQTDISKYYLTNYGFDEKFDYTATQTNNVAQEFLLPDGWTFYVDDANYTIIGTYEFGFGGKFNTASVPAAGYNNEAGGGLAISTGWGKTFQFSQTVTLPAGTYTLNVPTYNGSEQTSATSQVAWVPNSGTAVRSSVTSYPANAWTLDKITFTLTKTTTGKIQFGMTAAGGGSANSAKLVIDYVQLQGKDMAVDKSGLQTALNSANQYYGDGTGNAAAALKEAIDHAQGVYDNESADMTTVLEEKLTLENAILAYRLENVSEENPLDKTEYILNPSFEDAFKNWTTEGLQTQSNAVFTKKKGSLYVEKWVSIGNSVGSAYAKQTITGLPNGKYKLTVGAQNYSEDNTTKKNTGAYIFADDQQTIVYTPADYSVTFTTITGEVEIGFVADNATGNWLAIDNFRLYQIGYVSKTEAAAEVERLINVATNLQSSMMTTAAMTALQAAIALGTPITVESSDADMQAAVKSLKTAINAAQTSIANYEALARQIAATEPFYDESKNGATDFKEALDHAKGLHNNGEATPDDLTAEIAALDKALFAFRLANATPGTGTAPQVTKTVHYVATGATQALMRADVTGSNILEHGVCWSTERNPTVLDNRTTKTFSLKGTIYHIKGMQPATVYYLRPYVMNNTYTVAYGDEVKIVTQSKGTCTWSWDEAGPDEATNTRCRNAIKETIDYFNEWTGIQGFHLSGHYVPGAGAGDGTADCSYGGWMRISQNQPYQAIGTVLHETGHGVGVGTQARYWDTNLHDWWWKGRETNTTYQFLENEMGNQEYIFKGDGTHAWGGKEDKYSSFDWLVNGAHNDKHQELQYIGGMCILHSMFIDGLCPTTAYTNGISGYTYNFDDTKKYYLMNKDAERGLGTALLYQRIIESNGTGELAWTHMMTNEAISDSAAWTLEFSPQDGFYYFKNVLSGQYITHQGKSAITTRTLSSGPSTNEQFQLMPDRTDVTLYPGQGGITTHGYWFTWNNNGDNKVMNAEVFNVRRKYGTIQQKAFDFTDSATQQQWIIISEDELEAYQQAATIATGIKAVSADNASGESRRVTGIYSAGGIQQTKTQPGLNIVKYSDGTVKKIYTK